MAEFGSEQFFNDVGAEAKKEAGRQSSVSAGSLSSSTRNRRFSFFNMLSGAAAGVKAGQGAGDPFSAALLGIGGALQAPTEDEVIASREAQIAEARAKQIESLPLQQVSPDMVRELKALGYDVKDLPLGAIRQIAPLIQDAVERRRQSQMDFLKFQEAAREDRELSPQEVELLEAANPRLTGKLKGVKASSIKLLSQSGAGSALPNQSEFAARGYADKARQADENLGGLIGKGFDPSAPGLAVQSMLPNLFKEGNVQQSEQALRQFVNAILRRESGAAIPESELKNYRKQYWPEAGDSSDTLSQKTAARRLAIQGLEAEGSRVPSSLGAQGGPTGVSIDAIRAERERRKGARSK